MTRRELLLVALGPGCALPPGPGSVLHRAARFLWSRQAGDGGWHSETYGLLRSGQSLTPLVLYALVRSGIPPRPEAVRRAVEFLRRHTSSEGALGLHDPMLLDYPTYATALAARALKSSGRYSDVPRLVGYLRRQQFTEQNGWKPDDAPYGAWGMGGIEPRTPPEPGHVDLSMTRHALQALASAGVGPDDPAMQKARIFVERLQNPDGGFRFSTVVLDANKAGRNPDAGGYRSYGTATADGVLSLRALGYPADDRQIAAAVWWLQTCHTRDSVPGFAGPAHQRWTRGLLFYYAAAAAEAAGLEANLAACARPDGSWSNTENLVKEDDPLIATALAVLAMTGRAGTAASAPFGQPGPGSHGPNSLPAEKLANLPTSLPAAAARLSC